MHADPQKIPSIIVSAVLFFLIFSLIVLSYSAARLSETGFLRKLILEAAAPVENANQTYRLRDSTTVWKRYLFLVGIERKTGVCSTKTPC